MPKLYEYFGLVVFFYSNEHEPIHVHIEYGNYVTIAELYMKEGEVAEVRYKSKKNVEMLPSKQLKHAKELIEAKKDDIVEKWPGGRCHRLLCKEKESESDHYHQTIENMNTLVDNLQITEAEYISDYRIRFVFNDGATNEVDFYPFLSQPYQNPMVSQYLDQKRFRQFEIIKNRDISWDDYEMCFPLETLYTGKF